MIKKQAASGKKKLLLKKQLNFCRNKINYYLYINYFSRANFSGANFLWIKIGKHTVTNFKIIMNLYKYPVFLFVLNYKIPLLRMGCHSRHLYVWEKDFWNNNNEFPNDKSTKSNDRFFAFQVSKLWFSQNIKKNFILTKKTKQYENRNKKS